MGAGCLALAALAVYQVRWIAPELARIQAQIAQSFEVIKAAHELERTISDAERSERNHLITGDRAQLAEYRALAQRVPPLLAQLREQATDGGQPGRIPAPEQQIGVSLAEIERLATTYEREGPEAARRALRQHLGSDSLRRIADTTDAIVAAEDRRLAALQLRAAEHERTFAGAAIGAGLLALLVMALGAYELIKAFRNMRRSAEEQRLSEEQFRRFVAGVTDYAFYTMDPEGRVTSWNAGAERIKGYAAREILGRSFARFYTEEDQKAGVPRRALDTAAREGRYEAEARRVRKDGSLFWAHVVLDSIHDDA